MEVVTLYAIMMFKTVLVIFLNKILRIAQSFKYG